MTSAGVDAGLIKLMANLILTTDCQLNCEYCFVRHDREDRLSFSWDDFITAIDFISTAGEKAVNLLGGEPTLHKDFLRILEYLIENKFRVQVFTNGVVSREMALAIRELLETKLFEEDQVCFTINMSVSKEVFTLQTEFITILHKYTYPSFTIIDEETDLSFLIDLVINYEMDPTIRLSLALPVIGGDNKYLPMSSYREVAKNIVMLSVKSGGVKISFDCGFPLCMFTLDELNVLTKDKESGVKFLCGVPLDIYPDLTAVNCSPLSRMHRTDIRKFDNIKDLIESFDTGFMTPTGVYAKKCDRCELFRRICFGGCKSFYKPAKENEDG